MGLFTRCVFLTIVVLSTVFSQNASKRGLVATLKDNAIAEGCGCYFKFRGTPRNTERYLFFSSVEEDDERTAWMNIEGRNVKLSLARKKDAKRERVGSRSTRSYVADDISVEATYITTKFCKQADEHCESTEYDASFLVKKGSKSQVVKAIGSCGC